MLDFSNLEGEDSDQEDAPKDKGAKDKKKKIKKRKMELAFDDDKEVADKIINN